MYKFSTTLSNQLFSHIDSISAKENVDVVEELCYDAWGRNRNPYDWTYSNITLSNITDRGYTGHEHMTNFGLINMNGRVYDPYISQFLSPDPFVQDPSNPQNFNRFSYVLNNPLKYTDPSGYNYLIDGMSVSEHTFFRYMRNMSGTEMIFDMVGSWDFTLAIRSTVKNYIVTKGTAYAFANVYLDENSGCFRATGNNNRTNLWGGHNTSNFHLLYNLEPVFTDLDGDILRGFFIFEEIISKGKIITSEDFRRAVRMGESYTETSNREMYFTFGTSVDIGVQAGGGVKVNDNSYKVSANLFSADLFNYKTTQYNNHSTPWVHDFAYVGKGGITKINQSASVPFVNYSRSFLTTGEGHVAGSINNELKILVLKANDSGDRSFSIGFSGAFIVGFEIYFEFGSRKKQ